MAVKGGGVAAAAALAAAKNKALATQQAGGGFYRFQQRDKRRSGDAKARVIRRSASVINLGCADDCVHPPFFVMSSPSELMDLRKQFDEDRKKIAELRQSRAFKPY